MRAGSERRCVRKTAECGESCSAKRTHRPRKWKAGNGKGRNCGIEEVVSGQFSVVSRLFSGDPQGSAFQVRNADFGLRNRERKNCGMWISVCGMESESRITQKLSGRTKPFRRKVNAAREKGRGLPQSENDRRRGAAGPVPACLGARRGGDRARSERRSPGNRVAPRAGP